MYFGLIVLLFTVMTFSGRFVSLLRGGQPSSWTISSQADKLQLSEASQGEADLAGSTVQLTLTGTRGFAICAVWYMTMEKQKRHEWNEVEVLVNSVTKLQPHFLTPWLYQSWNLSYNVSVESDRVRDKYFYISKGINLLAEGERINRGRCRIADNDTQKPELVYPRRPSWKTSDGTFEEVGNPDMRFWIGFYYMNKFNVSDENNTHKCLFEMSCIKPSERTGLRDNDGQVDPAKFRAFIIQHPQLCRRLHDFLRCSRPDDIVDFLEDNAKVPTRYEERDGRWELKRKTLEQFPVAPDSPATKDRVDPYAEFGDHVDANLVSWAWHAFAQEPLPPIEREKPAFTAPPYDPLRYRMPRQPVSIIFRQYPTAANLTLPNGCKKKGGSITRVGHSFSVKAKTVSYRSMRTAKRSERPPRAEWPRNAWWLAPARITPLWRHGSELTTCGKAMAKSMA
jgi:hypothetical protein